MNYMKGIDQHLLAVNKSEKKAIAERFPNAHIVRTMKADSSRGHYYVEETKAILSFINELRSQNVVAEYGARNKR